MAMVERHSSVQDKARREEDLHRCARGCREWFAYLPFFILPLASHCVHSCPRSMSERSRDEARYRIFPTLLLGLQLKPTRPSALHAVRRYAARLGPRVSSLVDQDVKHVVVVGRVAEATSRKKFCIDVRSAVCTSRVARKAGGPALTAAATVPLLLLDVLAPKELKVKELLLLYGLRTAGGCRVHELEPALEVPTASACVGRSRARPACGCWPKDRCACAC
eukprot:4753941-Prymnesium_polylepis.1